MKVVTARRVLSNRQCYQFLAGISTITCRILWLDGAACGLERRWSAEPWVMFSDAGREKMFGILSHQVSELTFSGTVRCRGKGNVRGKFHGRNLSVMVGSGLLYQGAILFIEDTGEVAYRLDYMLTTLLRSEGFSGIVGIAIGQLLDGDTDGYTAPELLDKTLAPLGLPVIAALSIGHDTATAMPVVLGADTDIDVEAGSLVVSFCSLGQRLGYH
ncbi:hypothetical protein ARMGADRAFT_1162473 [Armillaria gallica]|uniref:LD-carboxypeptidase C-terminal domain-containing protein n=1 Tax=Armillaria gallica TaxID=47427 RepID=A0A2H3EDN9_ARMGA|nr:hypothetical protein ARMGADRAFT_1162473 [Armillaria gallica]